MDYSGMGRKALADCIERANFPYFVIGGRMMSHTDLVDKWFFELAIMRVNLKVEGEEESPDAC